MKKPHAHGLGVGEGRIQEERGVTAAAQHRAVHHDSQAAEAEDLGCGCAPIQAQVDGALLTPPTASALAALLAVVAWAAMPAVEAFAALVAFVALSALVALGTFPSADSFTSEPLTLLLRMSGLVT